jgi:hypothetical protein
MRTEYAEKLRAASAAVTHLHALQFADPGASSRRFSEQTSGRPLSPPSLLSCGHPLVKPDTQFASHTPARSRKPFRFHKVAFTTLWLSNCPSFLFTRAQEKRLHRVEERLFQAECLGKALKGNGWRGAVRQNSAVPNISRELRAL